MSSRKNIKSSHKSQNSSTSTQRPVLTVGVPYAIEEQLKEVAKIIGQTAGITIPPERLIGMAVEEWLAWVKKEGRAEEIGRTMAEELKNRMPPQQDHNTNPTNNDNKKYQLIEFDGSIMDNKLIVEYDDLQKGILDVINRLKESIAVGPSYSGYIWNPCLSYNDTAYLNATILFTGSKINYYMAGKGYSQTWESHISKPGPYNITSDRSNHQSNDSYSLSDSLDEINLLVDKSIKNDSPINLKLKKGNHEILYIRTFEGR